MNRLGMMWKSQKEISNAFGERKSYGINNDTLRLLVEQRKKDFVKD